jgi:hypothetical protein
MYVPSTQKNDVFQKPEPIAGQQLVPIQLCRWKSVTVQSVSGCVSVSKNGDVQGCPRGIHSRPDRARRGVLCFRGELVEGLPRNSNRGTNFHELQFTSFDHFVDRCSADGEKSGGLWNSCESLLRVSLHGLLLDLFFVRCRHLFLALFPASFCLLVSTREILSIPQTRCKRKSPRISSWL